MVEVMEVMAGPHCELGWGTTYPSLDGAPQAPMGA
jgi:hypothetical protein